MEQSYPLEGKRQKGGGQQNTELQIVKNCKRRGLEPYAYLKDVLTRLPGMTNQQIKDLPAAMAAANKQTLLQAAS